MIQKVNLPDLRLVVSSPKATENDPGSSQGGGNAYERLPDPKAQSEEGTENPSSEGQAESTPAGRVADSDHPTHSEQFGLGEVLREFRETHPNPPVRPGLTTQYQGENSGAKGLLLNKKVE